MIYDLSKMREEEVQSIQLKCSSSYLYYHKTGWYSYIYNHLLEQTGGKWEKAIYWFVSNSARTLNSNGQGFKISLRPEKYTNNLLGIGYRGVKSFLEWAEQKSYINIYKGFASNWVNNGDSVTPEYFIPSCLVFRQRYLDLWVDTKIPNLFEEYEHSQAVIVRDRKTKQEISGWEEFTKEEAESVMQYNDKLEDSVITFMGERIATPKYNRIYTDDIYTAGRLYVAGGGVQLLPQEMRATHLQIDGEDVVELDFSSIHPNICYQMLYNKGVPVLEVIGEDFKPYSADLSFVKVDTVLKHKIENITGKVHDPVRSLAKLAILIGMNSVDFKSAVGAMSAKIGADRKRDVKDQQFYAIKGTIPVSDILSAVKEHNDFIAENFYSDVGIVLQKYDSDICMKVVETIVQAGESVLCYHDSWLVKKSCEELLHGAMISAWESVFTDTTFCKIDKK